MEQARERGYHRALLLSDHRKDKDPDGEAEGGEAPAASSDPPSPSPQKTPTHTVKTHTRSLAPCVVCASDELMEAVL